MNLFLSYASEDRPRAEEIAYALRSDGHEVFFDRSQLIGGEHYNRVIREKLAEADLLVFLISPHSIAPGSYTLTELRIAEQRWGSPVGRIVPVLLETTPLSDIPSYLKAVTLFEPKGNAAAEIAAHLHRLGRRRRPVVWASAIAALIAVAVGVAVWNGSESGQPFVSSIAQSDFVSAFVISVERTEYALDPTTRFPADRGDVVRLERLSFGRLADDSKAFSVRLSIRNPTDEPILLDLTPRFFDLADDRGRHAELLYFCCEADGDTLAPGEERQIDLIYRSAPGWEGKETTPGKIHFRVSGLLPVVRATWSFRPLATAA